MVKSMSFYEERILPHIIDCACSLGQVMKLRSQVVPAAKGIVLEVGMGSGINLALYNPSTVNLVYGLEPSEGMRRKARENIENAHVPITLLDLPGERIPLDDETVDTILLTFTLCTIPDSQAALAQMLRVLKPGGELLFIEHGLAPERPVKTWQNRVNPVWKRVSGGCQLNRPISTLIADAGFDIETLETLYIPGAPRIAGYIYKGVARKPQASRL